ncbi:GNAT family N-acetyltransferase [Portibacter marinus]|uniref:GNAT family N-acetyltransferase n=1 Tax=Portibacter marinus TaxID=2898660 RepID=UPI001F44C97C|nr:GNAT family N-acetyltransferase [Portibacter marinus]
MLDLKKTNAADPDFVRLVKKLDEDLTIRDGDDHEFYDQYNQLDDIKYVVVAIKNGRAIGCGAIKQWDDQTMEVKRMWVDVQERGQGFASQILNFLEEWARELGFNRCILETGIRQPEAIGLYKKNRYMVIENYGQYQGVKTSVCFEKYMPS